MRRPAAGLTGRILPSRPIRSGKCGISALASSSARLAATVVRFERKRRPEALGAQPLTFALGLVAVAGIQLLFMGTGYTLLPCRALGGLFGDAMIAIGPLMLAYLIVAALTNLLALSPEA